MHRYTIRGFKYGDNDSPMARLQEFEDKIEDGVLMEIIRCNDCAVPHNRWTGCPRLSGLVPPPDFYCAYGEKENDR